MPQPFLLQDWTTVRGAANQTVILSFEKYLDLGGYVDIIFYLQVSEVSSSPVLSYQTAALLDEPFFATMTTRTLAAATTPYQDKVLFSSASVPLGRYVRWSITHTSAYSATFRVWAVARPG
jgi:hypothetical protein